MTITKEERAAIRVWAREWAPHGRDTIRLLDALDAAEEKSEKQRQQFAGAVLDIADCWACGQHVDRDDRVADLDVGGFFHTRCDPVRAAKAAAPEPASPADPYHAHLDVCSQCERGPFNLCPTGAALLEAAAGATLPAEIELPGVRRRAAEPPTG